MRLYIRQKPSTEIIFLDSPIKSWCSSYDALLTKHPVVIGDLAFFSKSDLNVLLIFLETNPQVDCYSSQDVRSSILLSRFTDVVKSELPSPTFTEGNQLRTARDFYNAQIYNKVAFLNCNTPLRSKEVL